MYGYHHHLSSTTTLAPDDDDNNRAANSGDGQGLEKRHVSSPTGKFLFFFFSITYTNIFYLKVLTFMHHRYHHCTKKRPKRWQQGAQDKAGKGDNMGRGSSLKTHMFYFFFTFSLP